MKIVFAIFGCLLANCATAQAGASTETVGALLLRLQEQSAAPFVQYCGAKLPEFRRALETEYVQFKKRFKKATAPLRARAITDKELSKAASRDLIRQFEEMDAQSFAQIQKLEARSFCTQLRDNLAHATADSIQTNMQSAFAQYKAAVQQGT
jgi:hypothetical protein